MATPHERHFHGIKFETKYSENFKILVYKITDEIMSALNQGGQTFSQPWMMTFQYFEI